MHKGLKMKKDEEIEMLKNRIKELEYEVGKKEKFTTSAVISYLINKKKMTIKQIRIMLKANLDTAKKWLKGELNFTQEQYEILVSHYPIFKNSIGGF